MKIRHGRSLVTRVKTAHALSEPVTIKVGESHGVIVQNEIDEVRPESVELGQCRVDL
jgi:hypothetical protein